jgi:cell division initiation protein
MRLSPLDIRQQHFAVRTFRGFDRHEVLTFLEQIAEDYESLVRENASLKEQLGGYEDRTRGLDETEKTLKETLVTTRRVADDLKEAARRDAQLVLREAGLNAEKFLEEARTEEAKLRVEVQALKRLRRQLIEDLKATVDRYDRTFAADLREAGIDVEPR